MRTAQRLRVSGSLLPVFHIMNDSLATVFEHIQNQFETFVPFVIRIGHIRTIGMPAAKFDHPENFLRRIP